MMYEALRDLQPRSEIGKFRTLVGVVGGFEPASINEAKQTIDDIRSYEDPNKLIIAIRKDSSEVVIYDRHAKGAKDLLRSIYHRLVFLEVQGVPREQLTTRLTQAFSPLTTNIERQGSK